MSAYKSKRGNDRQFIILYYACLFVYFHKDNAKWAYIISRELSEFEIQGPGKK